MVGFFSGPWTDIQNWRRAVGIQKSGGDLRVAYAGGAGLFIVVLGATQAKFAIGAFVLWAAIAAA
jgi:hypothetical protein